MHRVRSKVIWKYVTSEKKERDNSLGNYIKQTKKLQ
jgi:hypothetical protein